MEVTNWCKAVVEKSCRKTRRENNEKFSSYYGLDGDIVKYYGSFGAIKCRTFLVD